MTVTTAVTRRLGLDVPIIQAPMVGAASVEMVIAASNAGALGSFGAAYTQPDALREMIREIRAGTERPFGVNLFVPAPSAVTEAEVAKANAALAPIRAELGLPTPNALPAPAPTFADQAAVVIAERVPVFSYHFGTPEPGIVAEAKAAGLTLIGSATSAADARTLVDAGADMVIAQSTEAGGHQGTFDAWAEPPGLGLMALVPQIVDAVAVPVIAAGGIMDGRGIAACLALGAGAAQLGTAFLASPESVASDSHKRRILDGDGAETRFTRAFSGRPARGLANRFMDDIERAESILAFPYQNALTGDIRRAAAAQDQPEFQSMWAGQGVAMARALPTAELVVELNEELERKLGEIAT
ncbi:MAG: nitronate monooxygenase [Alphaproteobacteria bacterium]|nr:nitronate monooxygenase [Alphaproteobacteria bacterium]MDP6517709.1 nitronate monooxygenase [Alphaproteobacteria bacterium]